MKRIRIFVLFIASPMEFFESNIKAAFFKNTKNINKWLMVKTNVLSIKGQIALW